MKTLPLIIIVSILLLAGSFWAGFKYNKPDITYVNDTIYVNHTDTFTITNWKPYKVTVDSLVYDTLYDVDSIPVYVAVPISLSKYSRTLIEDQDSVEIHMSVSGYKTNIDSLYMKLKIHQEIIVPKPVLKPKRFMVGFQVGYSIDAGKPRPYVGIGLCYRIFDF